MHILCICPSSSLKWNYFTVQKEKEKENRGHGGCCKTGFMKFEVATGKAVLMIL